jgi:thymidylate synthase
MKNKFINSQEAFDYYYAAISNEGLIYKDTLVLFNVGFYLENPADNEITSTYRKWNKTYADFEWQWYLSGDPDATEIAKRAPIWLNHMDENGLVRSNYGWQWLRKNQLNLIIDKLIKDPNTRQAVISIYDGKEIGWYQNDTPCTLSIHFQIVNNLLCMTVNMRSNDLWFGFCNDQYCFSKLQEMVADKLGITVGWYYHFTSNMHLYNNFLNKNK